MPLEQFTYDPDVWAEPSPEDMGTPKYGNLTENTRRFYLRLTSDSVMERDVAHRELRALNKVAGFHG